MSQIVKKGILDNAVGAAKIRLENNTTLRARNAANSADINLFKVNASDLIEAGAALDMGAFRLFNAKIEAIQLASDPTGVTGQQYYNTTANEMRFYDGSAWVSMSGGGSGLNQQMSNMSGTVAANLDLIFDTGSIAYVKTKNAAAATLGMYLISGDSSGAASGDVAMYSGTASGATTGAVQIYSGANSGLDQSGGIDIASGSTEDGSSGAVNIQTGAASVTGPSGAVGINSGSTQDGTSGVVLLYSGGAATSGGTSGQVDIYTGAVAAGSGASGNVSLYTGATVDGASGSISLITGAESGSGSRGTITLDGLTVTLIAQPTGDITFVDGSEGTIGHIWTSTGVGGEGAWAANAGATPTWDKLAITLSGTDITNQYYDLTQVAVNDSVAIFLDGQAMGREGSGKDYTLSYTGGVSSKTRIVFATDWATGGAAALIAGDVLYIQHQY